MTKIQDSKLYNNLNDSQKKIVDKCANFLADIWKGTRLIPYYTEHGYEHSVRTLGRIEELLNGNIDSLNEKEKFLLILSTIFHDIGMQCHFFMHTNVMKMAEETYNIRFASEFKEELTKENQEELRKFHHYVSSAWLICAYRKETDKCRYNELHGNRAYRCIDLHNAIAEIERNDIDNICEICTHHSKIAITDCKELSICGKSRLQFLAALLRIGDELDIASDRINNEAINFWLPTDNRVHWVLHNRTSISIHKSRIKVQIALNPNDYTLYSERFKNYLSNNIYKKNHEVIEILRDNNILFEFAQPHECINKTPTIHDMSEVEIKTLFQWAEHDECIQIVRSLERETNKRLLDKYLDKQELDLSNINLIPENVFKIRNLKSLNLYGANISELPHNLFKLINLKKLDLRFSKIEKIPYEIKGLRNLRILDVRFTNVRNEDFTNMCNVESLEELYLWRTQISEVPSEIQKLKNLTILYLGGTSIREIPIGLCKLNKLTTLGLRETRIIDLPDEFEELVGLKYLYMGKNPLIKIPDVIYKLKKLEVLHLGYNKISEISDEIQNMKSLKTLYLNDTHLKELPEAIYTLHSLIELNLLGSKLETLSPSIKNLTKLNVLNLNNCTFKSLPKEITELSLNFTQKWDETGIFVNGLKLLEQDIMFLGEGEKGKKMFREYCEAMEGEKRQISECKIIFLGNGDAGKTSIIRALRGESFEQNTKVTNGISIKRDSNIYKECEIRMWDFGGQEINHSLHTMFMTENTIYIIVLSGRSDEKPELWLSYINTYGKNSSVIIVINKMDLNARASIDEIYYKKNYPNIHGDILYFSCPESSTGKNPEYLNSLKQGIESAIKTNSEKFTKQWPKQWVALKENLEKLQKSIITSKSYKDLCVEHEIENETQQAAVLKVCHDLGIASIYEVDENFLILKPEWLTEGVFKIVHPKEDSDIINNENAWVTNDEYQAFMKQHGYDETESIYMRNIMENRKLCSVEANKTFFPSLLQNKTAIDFQYSDWNNYIVKYPFVPNIVFQRFIVKNFNYLYKNDTSSASKYEIILEKDGIGAVVRREESQLNIFVGIIRGGEDVNHSKVKSFWGDIASSIYEVNAELKINTDNIKEYFVLSKERCRYEISYDEIKTYLLLMNKVVIPIAEFQKEYHLYTVLNNFQTHEKTEKDLRDYAKMKLALDDDYIGVHDLDNIIENIKEHSLAIEHEKQPIERVASELRALFRNQVNEKDFESCCRRIDEMVKAMTSDISSKSTEKPITEYRNNFETMASMWTKDGNQSEIEPNLTAKVLDVFQKYLG